MNANTNKILPDDPEKAAKHMIDLTKLLTEKVEAETNAIAMNDAVNFSVAEQDKQKVALMYQQAAEEFHAQVTEWRGQIEKHVLDELEKAQNMLGQVTKGNVNMLKKIPGADKGEE